MQNNWAGFEVLREVTLIWDVTPCNLVEIYRRFGGVKSASPLLTVIYLLDFLVESEDANNAFL
jgi:hypothetical protein